MKNIKIIFILLSILLLGNTAFAQIQVNRPFDNLPQKPHKFHIPKKKALPDLIVTHIDFEFDVRAEGAAFGKVKYIIKNIGNAPAKSSKDDPNGGYSIDLILSSDAMPPNGPAVANRNNECHEDVLIWGGRTTGETIEPGEERVFVDDNLTTPIGCQVCLDGYTHRQFGVVIDPANQLPELNDFNNHAFRTVRIKCDPSNQAPPKKK